MKGTARKEEAISGSEPMFLALDLELNLPLQDPDAFMMVMMMLGIGGPARIGPFKDGIAFTREFMPERGLIRNHRLVPADDFEFHT